MTKNGNCLIRIQIKQSMETALIMTDNLKITQPQDPKTINTHEEWEMNYWKKDLGVSKEQIEQAVKTVGNSVEKVKDYLNK